MTGGAARRVNYITREGEYSHAEARVAHQAYETGTEILRGDLVHWEAKNLPAWARDAAHFFDMAEKSTPYTEGQKRPRTAYSEWKFSLPRELSTEQYLGAAHDFLDSTFGDTHPYVYAVHCPPAADGGPQPHVHVLWSAALLDGIERSPAQFFKRYDTKHPDRGGAKNDLALTHYGAVKAFRMQYTDHMNIALEQAHQPARLHPHSLKARGSARTPEPRLDVKDSNALKFDGEITAKMQEVLTHRHERAKYKDKEAVQNRLYWEHRKSELGITRDLERAEQLEAARQARHDISVHVPVQRTGRPLQGPRPPRQHTAAQDADEVLTKRWDKPILGNQRSQIYHLPTHKNYGDVGPHHQVRFSTEREAQAAGYRRAKNALGVGADTPMAARAESRSTARQRQGPRRQHTAVRSHGQSIDQQMQELLARMEAMDEGEGAGRGVRVRLHDEDEERARTRDHGMGW